MPLNKIYNILHVHIPKCAGTSIENILDVSTAEHFYTTEKNNTFLQKTDIDAFSDIEYRMCMSKSMQHYSLLELKKILGVEEFSKYRKITVVRNPYDRLVSAYHFSVFGYKHNVPFSEFVFNSLSMNPATRNWLYDGHLETQFSYLANERGDLLDIDKIYKFENIDECISDLLTLTGKNKFPHILKSTDKMDFLSYYTPEIKKNVYNFYKIDFDSFGYNY